MRGSTWFSRTAGAIRCSVVLGTATVVLFGLLPAASVAAAASPAPGSVHPANCGKMNAEFVPACGLWWGASASKQAWPASRERDRPQARHRPRVLRLDQHLPHCQREDCCRRRTDHLRGLVARHRGRRRGGNMESHRRRDLGRSAEGRSKARQGIRKADDAGFPVGAGTDSGSIRTAPLPSTWRPFGTSSTCSSSKVKNVAWIWDVTGDIADHGAAYPSWYPGDHYVDWIMWAPTTGTRASTRAVPGKASPRRSNRCTAG